MRSHALLADLAEKQYGVVTYRQLRKLGFSKGHICRAHESSRLRRIHRGVYAVGHKRLSDHGRCLAAVLACGDGAVLSHHSAAWLWGSLPTCPREPAVTVPGRGHRRRGIRTHRVAALADRDCGSLEGLPVTTAERTLLDLADAAPARELTRAVDRARRVDRLDLDALDAIIARRSRTVGAKLLRKTLVLYRRPVFDRARSELLFLDAVEVDGWETHGSRVAFESDRLRQEELMLAGIESIRITARRIETESDQVAKRLRMLLSRRRLDSDRTHLSPHTGDKYVRSTEGD